MLRPLSIAIGSLMLAACGDQSTVQQDVDYSKLKITPQSDKALVLAEESALKQHLANGLRLQLSSNGAGRQIDFANGMPMPVASPDSAGGAGSDGGVAAPSSPESADGFSQTNVHVAGVDEADYAKYDGRHWFIATLPGYEPFSVEEATAGIKIVSTDPTTPDAQVVSEFPIADDSWGGANELYLVNDTDSAASHVAILRGQMGNIWPALPGFRVDLAIQGGFAGGGAAVSDVAMPQPEPAVSTTAARLIYPGPRNGSVRVDTVDVSDTSTPTKDWSIEIDGSLIQSRKIGNMLYLVTRYDPWLDELMYENQDLTVRDENEDKIAAADLEDLLPQYRIGDTTSPLSTDCYVQSDIKDNYGLSSLVHITAVDLSSQQVISSQCVNSNVENLSMSTESLYLTGTVYSDRETTVVHKFVLEETGPAYVASGKLKGSLGWRSDPVFRMHEHEDQFRIVTSSWGAEGPEHYLTVLQDDGGELRTLSELPNADRPAPIGKPNEDIYSVRFEENWAYIVTFQRTDPLYAIDLSNPADPVVAGELEVPGFATYMHPIGGDYLFTFGQDADENGRTKGLKAELISVAGGVPEPVTTLYFGDSGSYSPALNDLRALSFQPVGDDAMRIAVPMTVSSSDDRERSYYTGTQLLYIDGINGSAVMEDAGVIVVGDNSDGNLHRGSSRSRTVLHDDAVFVNYDNDVWFSNWFAPEEVKGPIPGELVACTTELRMGLSVTIDLQGDTDQTGTACDATVLAMSDGYEELLEPRPSDNPDQCIFVGAPERPGNYLIEASLAGYRGADAKTTVYHDECHVITEEIDMTLTSATDPTFCTAQVVPSLAVNVSSFDGNPGICDARVYVEQGGDSYPLELVGQQGSGSTGTSTPDGGADIAPAPPRTSCLFQGPGELPGEMVLYVDHPDYALYTQEVDVPADECHVITQSLEVILEP